MPDINAPADYLTGRRNAVKGSHADLNGKLLAIAAAFDPTWLSARPAASPVQRLWQRIDELATNELLNLGDAVERWVSEDPTWLSGQVKAVKGRDCGNAYGAIFEILGLNLFDGATCRVRPAPASKPGFDGTLELVDGSRVLVSVKNHGLSSYEKGYLAAARRFDESFQQLAATHRPNGAQVRVVFDRLPDAAAWATVKDNVKAVLAGGGSEVEVSPKGRPWRIAVLPIEQRYQPLSASRPSTVCQLLAPQHKNEQVKFVEDIRKGCVNLLRHTAGERSPDVCRMIMLRLSATASIGACVEWANWYFAEHGDEGLAIILLYQSAVVQESSGSSTIAHYLLPVTGPAFETWRVAGAAPRRLPNMQILVGSAISHPPQLHLSDGTLSMDLSQHYAYQRGHIFRTHDPTYSSGMIDMGSPAAGVSLHLVLETPGQPRHSLSVIDFPDRTLELLP